MSAVLLRLAARACAGLASGARVWLSPGLREACADLARLEPALRVITEATDEPADLALAHFEELRPGVVLPAANRVVGLGERFERGTLTAFDWAQRNDVSALELSSREGTLALREGGVVVTGLVDGLSARELQHRLTIPLLAGPGLRGLPSVSD